MRPLLPRWNSAGTLFSYGSALLILGALCAGFMTPSCREQAASPVDRNQPPQTVLVGVPGDSSTAFYRVRLYWNGIDPDGDVTAYEWAITDSLPPPDIIYRRTTRTDTVLVFEVEENRAILGHRFYIRAIDNEGKVDPTPAYSFFAVANNCIPVAWFTRAQMMSPDRSEIRPIVSTNTRIPTDTVPSGWSVEFAWTGSDCDREVNLEGDTVTVGHVVAYTYHLSPTELGYVGGELSDSVATYTPDRLSSNTHVMYVRARDDAGLSGLDPVVRTFVWNKDPVTYFFNPEGTPGTADTAGVFYAAVDLTHEEYLPYQHGDTLPITSGGTVVRATVRAYDPDPPHEIIGYNARLVKDSAFWADITADRVFDKDDDTGGIHYTGDYYLMARAQDSWRRWDGTPDTLRFFINFPPRWDGEWTTSDLQYGQRPVQGGRYRASGRDTLRIHFAGYDPDGDVGLNTYRGLELAYKFDKFPLPGGGTGSEAFFYEAAVLGLPAGADYYWDLPVRLHGGGNFIPGQYTMTVELRESYGNEADRLRFGTRITEQTIDFTLTP